MRFEVIGKITNVETIAVDASICEVQRLRRVYGSGRWQKLKGRTMVRLPNGTVHEAEVHWYERTASERKN